MLGFVLGGFVGGLWTFMTGIAVNIRKEKNGDGEIFLATLGEVKRELLRPFWRRGERSGT